MMLPSPVRFSGRYDGYGRIDQIALQRPEPGESPLLIRARKPGIADDVGHQDR